MKTATREAVREHGRKMLVIFRHATDKDPVSLFRKLRHLESRGNNLAVRKCNDAGLTYDQADKLAEDIVAKLDRLLCFVADKIPVFINSDPRGYALKICSHYTTKHKLDIERDWGGYGIIAPDLS